MTNSLLKTSLLKTPKKKIIEIKPKYHELWCVGGSFLSYRDAIPSKKEFMEYLEKKKGRYDPRMERATTIRNLRFVGKPTIVLSSLGLTWGDIPSDYEVMLLTHESQLIPINKEEVYLVYTPMPPHNPRKETNSSAVIGDETSEERAKTVRDKSMKEGYISPKYRKIDMNELTIIEG